MEKRLRTDRFKLSGWQKAGVIVGGVFVLFMIGAVIGYSVLGNGPVKEVLTFQPMFHIREIIHSK